METKKELQKKKRKEVKSSKEKENQEWSDKNEEKGTSKKKKKPDETLVIFSFHPFYWSQFLILLNKGFRLYPFFKTFLIQSSACLNFLDLFTLAS